MIIIIDIGLSNILSVHKAFTEVAGADEVIVSDAPDRLPEASRVVLPGVGNFHTGMQRLHSGGWIEPLAEAVRRRGIPLLGICLGLQLLAEMGEESETTPGLGWVPGRVRAITAPGLKLPHIGWDTVRQVNLTPLFKNVGRDRRFYFVHGYCLDCPPEYVVATCQYGETFPAAIQADNIVATQFHPEKSREHGLALLRNFVNWKC